MKIAFIFVPFLFIRFAAAETLEQYESNLSSYISSKATTATSNETTIKSQIPNWADGAG